LTGHPIFMARPREKGTALLVALAVTAVLVSVALAINLEVQRGVDGGRHRLGQTIAAAAASGAVHTAMAVLAEDKRNSQADSLAELWADREKITALAAVGADGGVRLGLRIEDERARLQVNALVNFPRGMEIVPAQQRLWERLLSLTAYEELRDPDVTPEMITAAIKDWLDRGDDDAITGLGGAESPYYASLPTPYNCRNGPLLQVEELCLVRGVGRPLIDGDGQQPGIGPLLTVFGMNEIRGSGSAYDGRVNINTAPLPLMMALLPEEYEDLALSIVEFRQQVIDDDTADLLADPLWYRNAPGCQGLTIEPELMTTASDHFRIQATAEYNGVRSRLTAVVQRHTDAASGGTEFRILMWQPS
jgi:general secretion pathway protein K